MIQPQNVRDCELMGSKWDIRESLRDYCRRGQGWCVCSRTPSAGKELTATVKIPAEIREAQKYHEPRSYWRWMAVGDICTSRQH